MGCTVGRGPAPAETLRFMGGSVESYMFQIETLRRGTAISPTVLSNIVPFNEPYKFQFVSLLWKGDQHTFDSHFLPNKTNNCKKSGASIAKGSALFLYQAYTIPWAFMASATFRKPAMLAPAT